jgi:ribosomal protein S18 acetylase RimI-like enzyme
MIATPVDVRLLAPGDLALLEAAGVDAAVAVPLVADPARHVAIALDGERVVGVAFGIERRGAGDDRELEVCDVSVIASHRRQGVGRRLLDTLLERGRAVGCRTARAEAARDDIAALRLVRGAGAVEVPEPLVRLALPLR